MNLSSYEIGGGGVRGIREIFVSRSGIGSWGFRQKGEGRGECDSLLELGGVLRGKKKSKTNLAIYYDIGSNWNPRPRIGNLSRSSLIQTADCNVSKVVHKRTECRDFGYVIVNQLWRHILETPSPDGERDEDLVVV
jgi:hypothetical protein